MAAACRPVRLCTRSEAQSRFQTGLCMQIAQIAPLTEAIPPKLYGGTERVISWLADELVALGHDVVLFASGDSQTSANLEACWPKALRLDGSVRDPNASYFAFLGRISPEKAVDQAIWIAKRCGVPLKIAAKVDAVDRDYFESEIRKLLTPPDVEFIGEVSDGEKSGFLSGAIALLAPIAWPEPFGLVLIEAMACGTPVIAFNRGSVPEIVEHGLTGFIVERKEEAVAASDHLSRLSRGAI